MGKMKITGIKGYWVALPKVSTTVIGGVNEYEGVPYRAVVPKEMESWTNQSNHFGHAMGCIVEITTDEGILGYGECDSFYGFRGALEKARQNLIGMDVYDVTHIMNAAMCGDGNTLRLKAKYPRLALTKELLPVEFALWDIIGKKAGLPVYKLMGGKVQEKVAITLFVGQKLIDHCIQDIDKALKEGIKTIKLKTGANDRRDIDLVREIRRQFGWDVILRLDANQGWGTVVEAVRFLRQVEPYSIQYAEGPFIRIESWGYKRLREMTGIPVCICEGFNADREMNTRVALVRLADLVRMDAIDVLSTDPARTGGLLGFNKIAAFCQGAGIEVVTHRARGSFSQAVWLTGCCCNFSTNLAHDIVPVGQPSSAEEDVTTLSLTHKNGCMQPLDAPGWGLEPNWDVINKYAKAIE
jgi:L-alanine-DL-glutamate epimerase-like enolase superfamily enzyme